MSEIDFRPHEVRNPPKSPVGFSDAQESPWKIISSLVATVADWVGPSFYLQGPHLQRLGFSVPLNGELEEEIGKRAFHDVVGRICMSPTLPCPSG